MNTASLLKRRARTPGLAILAALAPVSLFAGGMALTMQNGAHLGHAYSAGATAEDASTVFFNPAGLVLLEGPELIVGTTYVKLDGSFTNTGSLTAGAFPTAGGNEDDVGLDKFVPSVYVAHPFASKFAFGLGVSAPFGLGTDYDSGWVGRYHALRSELRTINVNPAIAWRATERLSFGLGWNWQRVDATLTNAVDFGLIGFANSVPGLLPGGFDGGLRIKGNDSSTGFNTGLLLEVVDGTRIGLHYRSKVNHVLEGRAVFTNVPPGFEALFPDQNVSAPLPLPEVVSLSFMHEFSPSLALVGDWSWWKWSRFETLAIDFESPLTQDMSQPQNWKDASLYSLGARWRSSSGLTWRLGVAYNETPVPSEVLRTARIPDSDRVWIAAGVSWRISESARGDFGYAHLFMKDTSTMNDDGLGHVLVGDYSLHADIVSFQLTWGF